MLRILQSCMLAAAAPLWLKSCSWHSSCESSCTSHALALLGLSGLLLQGSAAPVASWTSARVASDLALSKDLMLKLDAEKGIEQNALAPQLQEAPAETGATHGAGPGIASCQG